MLNSEELINKVKDYNKFLILDTEFHESFFKYFENLTVINSYKISLKTSHLVMPSMFYV